MVLVRTDFHRLFIVSVMAGVFCLVVARQGLPQLYGNATLDALVIVVSKSSLLFALLFGMAHYGIRWAGINREAAYMVASAICLLLACFAGPGAEVYHAAKQAGYASVTLLAPAIAGAVFGYIYWKGAGYDLEGDDVDELAEKATQFGNGDENVENALIRTSGSEYFDGPVQVRNSVIAAVLGAMIGGIIFAATFVFFVGGTKPQGLFSAFLTLPGMKNALSQVFVGGAMFGLVVLTVPIYVGHLLARMRDKTGLADYAIIGAIVPIGLGLLLYIVGVLMTWPFILPMASGMLVYRKYAGLEPKDVREDIIVRERRTLVGANHARRRMGRVIGPAGN
jgi:hypothetical protein